MPIVPFGEWLPDLGSVNNPGLTECLNALPASPLTYAPSRDVGIRWDGGARASGVQGAFASQYNSTGGGQLLFIASGTSLQWLDANIFPWHDVTPGAGWQASTDQPWDRPRFIRFNDTVIVIADARNRPQIITLSPAGLTAPFNYLANWDGGTSSGAPFARYIAVTDQFVVLAFCWDPQSGGTRYPLRVWWSGLNAPTSWPQPGSLSAIAIQSSFNDLPVDFGEITGLVGSLPNADCAVFLERGVMRMLYAGGSVVWDFAPAIGARGCVAPDSIVKQGNLVHYLSQDGFWAFDGLNNIPLSDNKISRWFIANVNQQKINMTQGVSDVPNQGIRWFFFSSTNVGPIFDHSLFYHRPTQRWSHSNFSGQFAMDSLFGGQIVGNVLELPLVVDNIGQIWDLTGPARGAELITGEGQLVPGRRAFIRGVRPLVDGGAPTVQILYRQNETDPQISGPTVAQDVSGTCPQRIDARLIQAHLKVPAGGNWTAISGLDVDAVPSGVR